MTKARDFHKVSPAIWLSERFRDLPTEAGYLWFYRHQPASNQRRMLPGARLSHAAADLKWDVEKVKAARGPLIEQNLIAFNSRTEEVFVCKWLQHNPPTNPKHAASINSHISKLKSDSLREMADAEFCETRWGVSFYRQPEQRKVAERREQGICLPAAAKADVERRRRWLKSTRGKHTEMIAAAIRALKEKSE